jgi:large subunit ribosomal protein L15
MKYNELKLTAHKRTNRPGRGIAAGQGKTAGRGTKGQNARKSGGVRPGFEGGQNPLYARLPKLRGFHPLTPKAENIYTGQLDDMAVVIDNASLAEAGLTSSPYSRVKLILKGDVTKKHTVSLQGASVNAIAAVEKVGGSFAKTAKVRRPSKPETEK